MKNNARKNEERIIFGYIGTSEESPADTSNSLYLTNEEVRAATIFLDINKVSLISIGKMQENDLLSTGIPSSIDRFPAFCSAIDSSFKKMQKLFPNPAVGERIALMARLGGDFLKNQRVLVLDKRQLRLLYEFIEGNKKAKGKKLRRVIHPAIKGCYKNSRRWFKKSKISGSKNTVSKTKKKLLHPLLDGLIFLSHTQLILNLGGGYSSPQGWDLRATNKENTLFVRLFIKCAQALVDEYVNCLVTAGLHAMHVRNKTHGHAIKMAVSFGVDKKKTVASLEKAKILIQEFYSSSKVKKLSASSVTSVKKNVDPQEESLSIKEVGKNLAINKNNLYNSQSNKSKKVEEVGQQVEGAVFENNY